jgi:hypothetical protein
MSVGKSPEISWQLPEAATEAATPEEIERAKGEFDALFSRLWQVMQVKGLTRHDPEAYIPALADAMLNDNISYR